MSIYIPTKQKSVNYGKVISLYWLIVLLFKDDFNWIGYIASCVVIVLITSKETCEMLLPLDILSYYQKHLLVTNYKDQETPQSV